MKYEKLEQYIRCHFYKTLCDLLNDDLNEMSIFIDIVSVWKLTHFALSRTLVCKRPEEMRTV